MAIDPSRLGVLGTPPGVPGTPMPSQPPGSPPPGIASLMSSSPDIASGLGALFNAVGSSPQTMTLLNQILSAISLVKAGEARFREILKSPEGQELYKVLQTIIRLVGSKGPTGRRKEAGQAPTVAEALSRTPPPVAPGTPPSPDGRPVVVEG